MCTKSITAMVSRTCPRWAAIHIDRSHRGGQLGARCHRPRGRVLIEQRQDRQDDRDYGRQPATTTTTAASNNGSSTGNGQSSSGATSPPSGPAPAITSFVTPDSIDCHNGNSQMFSASWDDDERREDDDLDRRSRHL